MRLRHGRLRSVKTLLLAKRQVAWVMAPVFWFALLLTGCDSIGWGLVSVDGYWKGQIVRAETGNQGAAPSGGDSARPNRILMQLEDEAGAVRGRFAQSLDIVAFRQFENDGSRRVSSHPVTGFREGPRIRFSFPSDDGRIFEIDALINTSSISGTYSLGHGTVGSAMEAPEQGTFEVRRY